MKVSIITVCLNAEDTIEETVRSVLYQRDAEIEYIVIDGKSWDSTLDLLEPYRNQIAHLISEKDGGLYDAMNKGIDLATGEVIGFLNADDAFTTSGAVRAIVHAIEQTDANFAYGDVEIAYRGGLVTRLYRGNSFDPYHLQSARLPPHPSVYIRSELFHKAGYFDTRFRIAADVELMLRIMANFSPTPVYIPKTLVRMRGGGISNQGFSSYWRNSKELLEACRIQGIKPNKLAIYGRAFRRGREVLEGLWSKRTFPSSDITNEHPGVWPPRRR